MFHKLKRQKTSNKKDLIQRLLQRSALGFILVALSLGSLAAFTPTATVSAQPVCPEGYRGGSGPLEDAAFCYRAGIDPDDPAGVTVRCYPPEVVDRLNCKLASGLPSPVPGGGSTPDGQVPDGAIGPDGEDPNAVTEPDPCPVSTNTALRWLYCPVFEGMNVITGGLDYFINQYMSTGNQIYDTQLDENGQPVESSYQRAWSTFRNLGIGLVVIAGLVMLVSEALGLAIVDAYTVRKVLPRLFIAIVMISISWELTKFIINLFDDLGQSIGSIIYTAFGAPSSGINVAAVLGANFIVVGGAIGYAWLFLGPIGLLSMLGTLILAMLVAAAVLVLRQGIIIAAVLIAPLAIASYVLPNTAKFFSFWWDTFIKMLMLYPIATGLIALCKVIGNLTMAGAADGDPVETLIATIVGILFFFAGYVMLPIAFRLAGGLVATIGGLANDRSRGGFDRLKKGRANTVAMNANRLKTGTRFNGGREFTNPLTGNRMSFGRRMNTISRGLATGTSGHFGMGARGAAAQHQAMETAANAVAKGDAFQAVSQYDDALRAGTYDTEAQARADGVSEAGINAWKAAGFKFGDRTAQYAAARQRVSTGTGFVDRTVGDRHISAQEDLESTLARVSHGNQDQIGALAGFANSETKKVGRPDLAPGAGNLINRVQQRAGVLPPDVAPVSSQTAHDEAWGSVSLYQHANSKPQNIRSHIQHYENEMRSGDRQRMERAGVFFEELKAIQPNASGGVRDAITETLSRYEAAPTPGNDLAQARNYLYNPNGATRDNIQNREITVVDNATGLTETRQVNIGQETRQRINSQSRTYQRPDPNNLN